MTAHTGNGATVVFASTKISTSSRLVSVGGIGSSGVAVDDSDLASTIAKMDAGDLTTYKPLELTLAYGDATEHAALPIYTAGTLTLTIPPTVSGGEYATYVGNVFLLDRDIGGLQNNERTLVTYVFQPTAAMVYTAV